LGEKTKNSRTTRREHRRKKEHEKVHPKRKGEQSISSTYFPALGAPTMATSNRRLGGVSAVAGLFESRFWLPEEDELFCVDKVRVIVVAAADR
jgi:hypothetical protein